MELELPKLEFHVFFFFTYSCVSWRPIVAFFMELEFHALLFIFKFDRPVLDCLQIKFYTETQF